MKNGFKKMAVVVVCAALSATAFAVTKKLDSSAGLSVINNSGFTVTTNPVSNCAIQFPTPVANQDSGSISTTAASVYPCFAVYSNNCTIEVTSATSMVAVSSDSSCQLAFNGMAVEMTSSS